MLFSNRLVQYNGIIPLQIKDAIAEIKQYYNICKLKVLAIDDQFIGIPVVVEVSIPTMGTIAEIDIRPKEPIIIRFNLKLYPEYAPLVLSDRLDFPKNKLSHLYASHKEDPAKLCLVRGNVNEWFAGKRIENFLDATTEWFYKAANGKLNDDGDEFDPLRLDSYTGYHSYRYNRMKGIIEDNVSFLPGHSFACLISMRYANSDQIEKLPNFKSEMPVQAASIDLVLQAIKKAESSLPPESKVIPDIAILVWQGEHKIFENYETELPRNYRSLKNYFHQYSIEIDTILQTLKQHKYVFDKHTPIIHAIKRPKKMIGFDGPYEFINFVVKITTQKKGKIDDSCKVWNQDHIEPFSSDLAQILTNEDRNSSTLFIGAGSLGSKIIMHDARSGKSTIGICDDDNFLQHNLARHTLYADSVGRNKANAIIEEIKQMYETEPRKTLNAYPVSVSLLSDQKIILYNWILDSTASLNVQNWFVLKSFPAEINVARCEVVDKGNVGLLYIEGRNRNPRIDDLINLAYYRALNNRSLAKWRHTDATKEPDTLNIGLGCSSISTVVSDDSISQHAAIFSRLLHNEKDRATLKENGLLFIHSINTIGIPETNTKFEVVPVFDVYPCREGSGWELRLINGLRQRLLKQCKKHKPNETGGILIGICNYKTKTIHVFDTIQAPSDSKSCATSFIRGIAGLPQKVDQIKDSTGGLIGYVGEWHTHPTQLEALSERDKQTVEELRSINQKVPLPTLSLIVTNTDLLPFIFN
ncbi:MAG: ThiF family adenylyltransferase [Chitinophagaceae bacterium]